MGEKRAYKARKPGGGRKKSKTQFDAGKNLKEQMDAAVALYEEDCSLQSIADALVLNDEQHLWKCIVAFQGYRFKTIFGLPFSYKIKTGRNGELTKELWIDRRESSKSLTWSSVLLAFEKTEGKPLVERPKALGDIRGVAYIYGMFYRFGLIEVPVKQDEPRSDPTS